MPIIKSILIHMEGENRLKISCVEGIAIRLKLVISGEEGAVTRFFLQE